MRALIAFIVLMTSAVFATAQDDISINCAAFQKQPGGAYRVVAGTIVKIGRSTIILSVPTTAPPPGVKVGLSPSVIAPGTKIGNADVYGALENQCGGAHG
jgi:hypothetical protein